MSDGMFDNLTVNLLSILKGKVSIGSDIAIAGNASWGNSILGTDQGGCIELGGVDGAPGKGTPYIDFHFKDMVEDFNTRIINDANSRLTILANTLYLSGNVGIGTANPVTNAILDIQGGGLNIGGTGNLDAAIHVKSSYGAFSRLLQMSPTGASKPGLNLLASTDATSNDQWWSWGVDTDNKWKIQPGAFFSGATGFFIDSAGSVGIGTTSPVRDAMLDIQGGGLNIGGTGNLDAAIHVKSSYGAFNRLLQMSPTGASKPGLNLLASTDATSNDQWWSWGVDTDNKWKIQPGAFFSGATGFFIDSAGNVGIATISPSEKLEVNGNIKVTGDVILANAADCAEDFDVVGAESVEPGTVMVIDKDEALRPSEQAYDKRVAGVISGAGDLRPGITLNKQNERTNRLPLALTGKVYCKIDAQYNPIEVGDLLTTSPTCGHAMKADDPFKAFGTVIGKALNGLSGGKGLIPILVALQ